MDIFVNFLATYLIALVFVSIAFYYFFIKKDYRVVFKLILVVIISILTQLLFNFLYFTPRPYMMNNLPTHVAIIPTGSSFPSGHAMTAFALATIIFLYNRKLGIFLFIVSGIIGAGRVLANVHYPTDIIGGLILGVTIGGICDKITPYARYYHSAPGRKKA